MSYLTWCHKCHGLMLSNSDQPTRVYWPGDRLEPQVCNQCAKKVGKGSAQ